MTSRFQNDWHNDEDYILDYDSGSYRGSQIDRLISQMPVIDKEAKGHFVDLRDKNITFWNKGVYVDSEGKKIAYYDARISVKVLLKLFQAKILRVNRKIQRALKLDKEKAGSIIISFLTGQMCTHLHINAYQKIDQVLKDELPEFMSIVDGQHRVMVWTIATYGSSKKSEQFPLPDFVIQNRQDSTETFNLGSLKSLNDIYTKASEIPMFAQNFIELNFFSRDVDCRFYKNLSMRQESELFVNINTNMSKLSAIDLISSLYTSPILMLREISHAHSVGRHEIFDKSDTGNKELDEELGWVAGHFRNSQPFEWATKYLAVWNYYGRDGKRRPMDFGTTPAEMRKFYENELTEISDADFGRFLAALSKFYSALMTTLRKDEFSAYRKAHKPTHCGNVSRTLDKFAVFLMVENNINNKGWFKGKDNFTNTKFIETLIKLQDQVLNMEYDFQNKTFNVVNGTTGYKDDCGSNGAGGLDDRVDWLWNLIESTNSAADLGIVTLDERRLFDSDWQKQLYIREMESKGKVVDAYTGEEIKTVNDLEGDHYIPWCWGIENGGVTEESNYRFTLKSTNRKKRSLSGPEFEQMLKEEGKDKSIDQINS